jgi:hypothetical protein
MVLILGAAAAAALLVGILVMGGSEAKAASCARGTKPAIVAGNFNCLRAGLKCSASYQVQYRKYGFHCANSRLRRGSGLPAKPTPSPATPPPYSGPEPPAFYGHYKGVTSQNETIEFDMRPGGIFLGELKTGQINQGCTPADIGLYGGNLDLSHGAIVSASGDFTIDESLSYGESDWSSNWSGHVTIHGHLFGSGGSGSLEVKTAFNANGVAHTCGSGLVTWTVMRAG